MAQVLVDFSVRSLQVMSILSLRPALHSGQYARMFREGDSIGVQHLKHDWTRQEQNVGSWLRHSMKCCVGCVMVRNIALTESGTVALCVCVDKDPSVPSPEDFLDEIRGLSVEVHYALRVLVLHQGRPRQHRNGYARKDQLSHLSWVDSDVPERLKCLCARDHAMGRRAYKWLLRNNPCYAAWIDALRQHLVHHGKKALQPSALLLPLIECALWPVLYIKP